MAEYTYKDIIIDPTSEEAKNAVGKKCFVSNIPTSCLEHANENNYDFLTKLNSINLNLENPFNVKFNGVEHNFNSIIVKKEEPKKYVPFKNGLEFSNLYLSVESRLEKADYFLSNHGIWLKDNDIDDVFYIVTEIWKDGVVLGSDQSTTKWKDLLDGYAFLDGTPCGRFVKESDQ